MANDTAKKQKAGKRAKQSHTPPVLITDKLGAVKKCSHGERQVFWDNALSNLESAINIQCQNGNWNYDEYQYGLANGLLYAFGLMTGRKPQYLPKPKEWVRDKKAHGGIILPK